MALGIRETQDEYSFQDEDSKTDVKKRPVLSVTCRAGLFFLILLIISIQIFVYS